MINRLRKKFVLITALSVGIVFALVFGGVYLLGRYQVEFSMDLLADVVSANGGVFPQPEDDEAIDADPEGAGPEQAPAPGTSPMINPDAQMNARFFSVTVDADGNVTERNLALTPSISDEEAKTLANSALSDGGERGWASTYRYKITEKDGGRLLVFVDAEANISMTDQLLWSVLAVLVVSFALILLLIVVISKLAMRPAVESYQKQRQFVTDANHELKTPLTLILSNVDIVESEIGKNEWLDDIRSEGERMELLINQLGSLSRMDEDGSNLALADFDLSALVSDAASEFTTIAAEKHESLACSAEPGITYRGDEELIRRLVYILLDNAVKYCDHDGGILVRLSTKGRGPILVVENSYANVEGEDLDRLFDRFYRADRARTYSGGFGIGLSMARSIARNHGGDIVAYKRDSSRIGFKVTLR